MKKKLSSDVLRWIATGFLVVSAVVYLPSLASCLLLAAAILSAPLPALDKIIREQLHLKRAARIAIVTIVFFAGIMVSPAAETSRANTPAAPGQITTSQVQVPNKQAPALHEDDAAQVDEPYTEPQADALAEDAQHQEGTGEGESVSQPKPTPVNSAPAQEPVSEPTAPSQPAQEKPTYVEPEPDTQGRTVYITNTGSKYHSAGCRHLKDSQIAIDVNSAIAQGYTPCKVCGG